MINRYGIAWDHVSDLICEGKGAELFGDEKYNGFYVMAEEEVRHILSIGSKEAEDFCKEEYERIKPFIRSEYNLVRAKRLEKEKNEYEVKHIENKSW